MSCASVFEFGSPNDGVLVTEETVPFLAYHTTSYEVFKTSVYEYSL